MTSSTKPEVRNVSQRLTPKENLATDTEENLVKFGYVVYENRWRTVVGRHTDTPVAILRTPSDDDDDHEKREQTCFP